MRVLLASVFGILAASLLPAAMGLAAAQAAEEVGDTKRVVNTVTGSGAVGARRLATEDPVYRGENIAADAASRGELLLRDGSRVIVGEGSTISLDDFVIASNGFASGTIKVTKGAFRLISGNSPKGAIGIETPLSTIGIRGTVVDIYVAENGVTRAVLINGKVTACTKARNPANRRCQTTRRACDILEVSGPGEIRELPFLRSMKRTRPEEASLFGLTEQQERHSPQWRAFEGGCMARAAEEARGGQQSDGEPGEAPSPDVEYDL